MPDTYADLFFAYTAVWVLIAVFVLRVVRGQAQLWSELEKLKRDAK